ncbi:MAG: hypothetical protein AABW50_02575 [Nanoarchaeota archaeon]
MVKLNPSETAERFISVAGLKINSGFLPDSFGGNKKIRLGAGFIKTRWRFL